MLKDLLIERMKMNIPDLQQAFTIYTDASQVAVEAMDNDKINEQFFEQYDKRLWDEIGMEIKASYRIQRLGKKFPHLIDKVVEKALKDKDFKKKIEEKLPYAEGKKEMGTTSFVMDLMG